MDQTLPATLTDCHALIRSLRRERAQLLEELEAERDFGFRLIDDREFSSDLLATARSVGTTRLGFYGRVADPYTLSPEDVP